GTFDAERYEFYFVSVEDVIRDLTAFRDALAEVNPRASIVFTVSPVPLVATAVPGAHVLSSTTYSKSVLRVAAETMRIRFPNVHYFPSYEIITGAFNRGAYYAADLRNVVEDGVAHVMRLFMAHATDQGTGSATIAPRGANDDDHLAAASRLVEVECDEVALDKR
nr:GSCFA domain-containing protein [Sphingomonas sp.]